MHSVADDLRRESAGAVSRLTAMARIELSLRLGDDDAAMYRAAHGITGADARDVLARARALGRVPSCANDFRP